MLVGAFVDAIVLTRVLLRASGVVESSTATVICASVLVVASLVALVVTDSVVVTRVSLATLMAGINGHWLVHTCKSNQETIDPSRVSI